MYKCCRLFLIVLQFIVVSPVFAQDSADPLHIPFGKSGLIAYDLKTGLMNVYQNNRAIFSNVYSQVRVDNRLISSKDYSNRTYIKTAVNNGFGTGEK
jgi:alpha-galactosidase